MSLLDRHVAFLEALRAAGLPVSLSEDLDAVSALSAVAWSSRDTVRDVYAATLVKRQSNRATFESIFDLYYPRMIGDGHKGVEATTDADTDVAAAMAAAVADIREALMEAAEAGDTDRLRELAAQAMAQLGAMPGRGPGLSSWSSYTALRRIDADELIGRLVDGLMAAGWTREEAERTASRRLGQFTGLVEADARRRIAEEKGAEHVARITVRPSIDRLDFLSMRRSDIEELRSEIYPLARRLATRLAREQHAKRRGPLDFRRTVRSSLAYGGVPLETHHKPKRPHRNELVVLCDVSGSVANFASFTLLLVFALQEAFTKVRAFTFVDKIHEVTKEFKPGGDVVDTMERLVASSEHAARMGRTNYGRAFAAFRNEHFDALTPKTSLLILGDARSNYSDLALNDLRAMVGATRHAFWLNPEVRRQWDTGDSEATAYGNIVDMVECRNLVQLQEFIHDLA
jgi:uncharacterized protein